MQGDYQGFVDLYFKLNSTTGSKIADRIIDKAELTEEELDVIISLDAVFNEVKEEQAQLKARSKPHGRTRR